MSVGCYKGLQVRELREQLKNANFLCCSSRETQQFWVVYKEIALDGPRVILYAGVYSNTAEIYSYTACNTLTLAVGLQSVVCQNELTDVSFVCCSVLSLCVNFFL